MGKQSKRPARNKKKGGSNSSPSKTTAAAATIAAATATAASISSSSSDTLPKINHQQQQQYHHNKNKNENIVVDRHGGESSVGPQQKTEKVNTVGKESNISVRPMGWTAPFESNYVGKYDREDQCVSWQGVIDIENHPWFCGHTGRILMV